MHTHDDRLKAYRWGLAVALVLTLVVGTAMIGARQAAAGISPQGQDVDELRSLLAGSPDTQLRQSLEAKLAIAERVQADNTSALAHPVPKPSGPNTNRPAFVADSPRPTGIIEEQQAPYPAALVRISNQWQRLVNGEWVHVYAGSLTSDPTQGVVLVMTESPDQMTGGHYPTPTKEGSVRITGEQGLQITLTSSEGATFVFDVSSRSFEVR